MIIRCNYEEVSALKHGARAFLEGCEGDQRAVAAPPEAQTSVAALLPQLVGDLALNTLEELRSVQAAVEAIVVCLRVEMETAVAATHPADEQAVSAYFDFAHAYAVQARLADMGSEMEALIELMTGERATDDLAREFVFPD
jgi:hypothetical protein